ncbi:hypothetical protein ACH4A8_08505 [Streptomyces vietnamensis]|uniref:hypothetical protein n=1 Tax=Streptomyces vietnamensis TaxID=362257 RepID=UPI0037BAF383
MDASYFTLLDEAVQAEPVSALDPEVAAPIAAVGIVKDRSFAPDRNWFAVLRFYSPLPAFFDKSWQPDEIEPRTERP